MYKKTLQLSASYCTQRLKVLCNYYFLKLSAFSKIDCHTFFTVTRHCTLFDTEKVLRMILLKKYNFMTEIPETRCLKLLFKFSLVAKNT